MGHNDYASIFLFPFLMQLALVMPFLKMPAPSNSGQKENEKPYAMIRFRFYTDTFTSVQ